MASLLGELKLCNCRRFQVLKVCMVQLHGSNDSTNLGTRTPGGLGGLRKPGGMMEEGGGPKAAILIGRRVKRLAIYKHYS